MGIDAAIQIMDAIPLQLFVMLLELAFFEGVWTVDRTLSSTSLTTIRLVKYGLFE